MTKIDLQSSLRLLPIQWCKATLAGDLAKLLEGEHFDGLIQILAHTHAEMTSDEFRDAVEAWLTTAKHPRYGKPHDELTDLPMQELLSDLRAHGFKSFIVSGGGVDFMRVWVERVYGIPPGHPTGKLVEALREAPTRGWVVVDMKQDWKAIFRPE